MFLSARQVFREDGVQQVRKWEVELSLQQREELTKIVRPQSGRSLAVKRARVLLLCDQAHPEGRRTDKQTADLVGLTTRQVQRIRLKFLQQGLEGTLRRKIRSDQGVPKVFDGAAEAQLVTLCLQHASGWPSAMDVATARG